MQNKQVPLEPEILRIKNIRTVEGKIRFRHQGHYVGN